MELVNMLAMRVALEQCLPWVPKSVQHIIELETQRRRALSFWSNIVIGDHPLCLVVVDMADDLPQARLSRSHIQSLPHAVVKADSVPVEALVRDAVPMHVEHVARSTVGVDVPDHIIAHAHIKGRVV